MSLSLQSLQLEILSSHPKLFITAAAVLIAIAQTSFEKWGRALAGRAPMVSYYIPWVGSALEIGKDPDAFFDRARRRYGDVFTVKAFGRVVTYVASPSLISEVYRNAQKYDFDYIRMLLDINYFGVPASLMKSDVTSKILHPTQHKYLSSAGVAPVLESYSTAVWEILEKEGSRFEGVSTPLRDFVFPVLYQASAYAFFGRSCPVVESYKPFQDYDGAFHFVITGVPRFFLRAHVKGLATLQKLFEKYFDGSHEDASEMVLENERVLRSYDYDSKTIGAFFVSFLFGLMGNAPKAAYWLIVLNLQREEGLQSLTGEVDEAVSSWKKSNPGQNIEDHLHEFVSTTNFPLLTSTVHETLRYTTSNMPMRRVTEPTELGGYRFTTDDEVLCVTRLVHFDEEIHENPWVYNPRRYMAEKQYTKNGKVVANHSMVWGGGVSMCEGRHFATKELKTFMVFLPMRYTVEFDPKSEERPTFLWERTGAGVMDPKGDVRVILRARK